MIFFILIIILLILGSIFFFKTDTTLSSEKKYSCICAFDVDDTITNVSKNEDIHNRALNAIKQCKDNNCKIVINTARMPISNNKWDLLKDLPHTISKNIESIDDIYHGEDISHCSYLGNECLYNQIAETKVKHLKNIAVKYDMDHKKIILFDDLHHNITKASNHGFSTVYANYPTKGIDPNFKLVI